MGSEYAQAMIIDSMVEKFSKDCSLLCVDYEITIDKDANSTNGRS